MGKIAQFRLFRTSVIVSLCKTNLSDEVRQKKRTVSDMFLRLHICEKLCGPSLWQQGLHIHRGNTILWLPGLQLSVFIFLGAVVPLLGLLGQLPAILGFIIVVSSALIVCWPIGSLRIRAGPECTHKQNSDVM